MREIKFRGKRKDNGDWIEGSLVLGGISYDHSKKDIVIEYRDCYIFTGKYNPNNKQPWEYYEVFYDTVGQYPELLEAK